MEEAPANINECVGPHAASEERLLNPPTPGGETSHVLDGIDEIIQSNDFEDILGQLDAEGLEQFLDPEITFAPKRGKPETFTG
ncbi:hypothetical protein AALO_G00103910 [Alosa alosa]|uniref:Uncharacterized protein n=1 Tax=Alosa alosa TaxID=278164 RepID=A0AAV6GVD9_9TELE|nr:hypothetical protein AALO_G00103910 [Alosa alosa]